MPSIPAPRAYAGRILPDGVIAVARKARPTVAAADVAGVGEVLRAHAEDARLKAERIAVAAAGIIIVRLTPFRIVIRHQVPRRLLHEARHEVRHGRLLRALERTEVAVAGPVPVLADAPAIIASGVPGGPAAADLVEGPAPWVGEELVPQGAPL